MSFDAIRQIDEVEQSAKKIVADARENAVKMVEGAKTEAQELYDAERARALSRADEILAAAKEEDASVNEKEAQKAQQECETLEKKAGANMDAAVALIIEKVVSG